MGLGGFNGLAGVHGFGQQGVLIFRGRASARVSGLGGVLIEPLPATGRILADKFRV